MTRTTLAAAVFIALGIGGYAHGDGLLFSYEGDVLLGDPGSGFEAFEPCDGGCSHRLEDGHFLLEWGEMGGTALYSNTVAGLGDPPPPHSLGAPQMLIQQYHQSE